MTTAQTTSARHTIGMPRIGNIMPIIEVATVSSRERTGQSHQGADQKRRPETLDPSGATEEDPPDQDPEGGNEGAENRDDGGNRRYGWQQVAQEQLQ